MDFFSHGHLQRAFRKHSDGNIAQCGGVAADLVECGQSGRTLQLRRTARSAQHQRRQGFLQLWCREQARCRGEIQRAIDCHLRLTGRVFGAESGPEQRCTFVSCSDFEVAAAGDLCGLQRTDRSKAHGYGGYRLQGNFQRHAQHRFWYRQPGGFATDFGANITIFIELQQKIRQLATDYQCHIAAGASQTGDRIRGHGQGLELVETGRDSQLAAPVSECRRLCGLALQVSFQRRDRLAAGGRYLRIVE